MSDISIRRVGAATALWGLVFAAFHFYWAAGGTAGHDPEGQSLADSLYIAFIAVIGLVSVVVAHGLYRPWGNRMGRRRLRMLARVGGTLLLLGVAVGVGGWIAAGSIGDDGADGVVITAYFLLGALLFSALGWHRTSEADARKLQRSMPEEGGRGQAALP